MNAIVQEVPHGGQLTREERRERFERYQWERNDTGDVRFIAKVYSQAEPLLRQPHDRDRQREIRRLALSLVEVEKRLEWGNDLKDAVRYVIRAALDSQNSLAIARSWWSWIDNLLSGHSAKWTAAEQSQAELVGEVLDILGAVESVFASNRANRIDDIRRLSESFRPYLWIGHWRLHAAIERALIVADPDRDKNVRQARYSYRYIASEMRLAAKEMGVRS